MAPYFCRNICYLQELKLCLKEHMQELIICLQELTTEGCFQFYKLFTKLIICHNLLAVTHNLFPTTRILFLKTDTRRFTSFLQLLIAKKQLHERNKFRIFSQKLKKKRKNSQLTQAGTPAQLLGMIRKQFDKD